MCPRKGVGLDRELIIPALLAAALLLIGLNGLFTPYPRNWLKLRWGLGAGMPWSWKIRVPKILGAILLAGGIVILVDLCIHCIAPPDDGATVAAME